MKYHYTFENFDGEDGFWSRWWHNSGQQVEGFESKKKQEAFLKRCMKKGTVCFNINEEKYVTGDVERLNRELEEQREEARRNQHD